MAAILRRLGDAAGVREVRLDDGDCPAATTRLKSQRENSRSPVAIGMAVVAHDVAQRLRSARGSTGSSMNIGL